jgi:hypothetical protein
MLAVSIDNLLFFLLIAIAALFQLLSTALKKGGKSEPDETSTSPTPRKPPPIPRAPAESDADRIRKFLEALGQPASSTPPAPVAPRTDIPPRRLAPVQPPPVLPGTWRLPREQRQKPDVTQRNGPPPQQPGRTERFAPPFVPAPAAPTFQVHEASPLELQQPPIIKAPVESYAAPKPFGVAKTADLKADIAILLGSKSGLRDAIVLREILGPPRSLQPVDAML